MKSDKLFYLPEEVEGLLAQLIVGVGQVGRQGVGQQDASVVGVQGEGEEGDSHE